MTESEFRAMLLDKVITVKEVCAIYGVTSKTVMMAIFKGKIVARQAEHGAVWLVLRSSAEKHFNNPEWKERHEKLAESRSRKFQAVNQNNRSRDAS